MKSSDDTLSLGLLRKKSLEEIFNEIWPLVRNNNTLLFLQ